MKKALIVYGGWEGHEPVQVSEIFERVLLKENFDVKRCDNLDAFLDVEYLKSLDLIVPLWTMGTITEEQEKPVEEAVASGVGIAGCHGGMCDAFRNSTEWQFMTGGQWVAHPGGEIPYRVNIKSCSSELVSGIKDFDIVSEQYYVHVDPCIDVLATTTFPTHNGYHASNGKVDVPVAWTKRYGHGRVYYNALGHVASVFDIPEAIEMMRRGFLWAAEGKEIAVKNNLSTDVFKN